jgi:nitroreductase
LILLGRSSLSCHQNGGFKTKREFCAASFWLIALIGSVVHMEICLDKDMFGGMRMEPNKAMLSLMHKRRSVPPHALAGPGPEGAELDELLALAARVPDHGKLHPWRFIVFNGAGQQRAGAIVEEIFCIDHPAATDAQRQAERARMTTAPLVIGVVSCARDHVKIPQWEQKMSAGAVCMSLVMAAHAMGYAASWLTQWLSYDRRVLERFGVGEGEQIAGYIHIGRPTQKIDDRERPDVAALTTYFIGK